MRVLVLALLVLLQAANASGQERQPLPLRLQTVTDEAGILTPDERQKLSAFLQDARERTGVRMIMLIARTTGPESIHQYAERLARRWRDERGVDPARAIIIIAAMQERQMQVLPGRALRLNEALHEANPTAPAAALFAQGRYFDGLIALAAGVRRVIEVRTPRQ